ncbi:MAG TPA: hypothetical protein VF468_09110 [Actinomycetota bacterium]|nr:hypothetical protein [Actinomycetota bacterium]
MSMFTAADRQARVLRRRLLYAVVGVGLVVAAIVIGLTGLGVGVNRDRPADVPLDGVPPAASSSTGPATPSTGAWVVPPVSAGPLILPPPAGTARGVPVGFPHTVPGAISAAARYAETAVGLDETRARTVGEVAGAPSYPSAADDFAHGVRIASSTLGVQPGDAGIGAYLTFQARAYRVVDAGADRALIHVLGIADGAGPATSGQGRQAVSVAAYTMVWADGDWKIDGGTDLEEPQPLPAPGSAQAYERGWRDLAIA